MHATVRALTALVSTGLLLVAMAPAASAEEGTMEVCIQQTVGNLRKSTNGVPCKPNSENTVTLQTGEPGGGGGGGVNGRENVMQATTVPPGQGTDYEVSCPGGKVATGAGWVEDPDPVYGNPFRWITVYSNRPVGTSTWRFSVWNGDTDPPRNHDIKLWVACVTGS